MSRSIVLGRDAVVRPLLLALVALLAACGGGGTRPPAEPFVAEFPVDTPGRGGFVPLPPAPPAAPPTPVFEPDAWVHDRVVAFGSFPSDVVLHGTTVFTTDGDEVDAEGASVVPLDVDGPVPVASARFLPLTLTVDDLVDSDGQPASLTSPIGFGAFLGDLLVVDDRLAFVLVNAGGSDTTPGLANLVAFDPVTGQVLQVVDLATAYVPPSGATDSDGTPIGSGGFRQSAAEALAWVPGGAQGGLLFVAMSNLVFGPPSYGTVHHPGTLQILAVRRDRALPVSYLPQGGLTTETLLVPGFNPVALTTITSDPGPFTPAAPRLLVTVAGASAYDASYQLVPSTDASIEVFDPASRARLGSFRLGLTGLAATRPAIGRDPAGHRIGYFPSAVTGEIYLLWLDGVYAAVLDPSRLRVLRGPLNGIDVLSSLAGQPGANISSVALSPDGHHLVVAGFGDLFRPGGPAPGLLVLLSLPDDALTGGTAGPAYVPGVRLWGSAPGRTLGAMALLPGGSTRPDVFLAVNGPLDATTFLGTGPASLGTLRTFGILR